MRLISVEKAELIALLQNNPTPPLQVQSVRFRPDRLRQPERMRRLDTQPAQRPAVPGDPLVLAPCSAVHRGPCEWRPPPKRDTEFKPYQLKPKRDLQSGTFLRTPH